MTAEAGECSRRSEGSKGEFERKSGGDLKDADIACRDGEEIGGSSVIVNGDSDDHSDRDVDLEKKSDPSTAAENGELKPENGETEGKVESLTENGVVDGEKFSEVNGGTDDKLEEKRSNGGDIDIEEEKEESEVDAEDELNVVGSGSDIKAEQEQESVNEGILDSDALMEGEEVEDDVDRVKAEENEKKDNVDSESEVKIKLEEEGETVDGKDLGSADAVEGKQDREASVVEAEDKEEVLPHVEERERDAEVPVAESDAKVRLGSAVEGEDIKEAETVVTETNCLMKSESASLVGEEQERVSVMAEVDDNGGLGEESQNSVNGVGETENAEDSESTVETELRQKQEPQTVAQQTENVAELEPAVEELKQESNTGVKETEESVESGAAALEVESAEEPTTVVEEMDKAEAEEKVTDTVEVELKEPKVLVEENSKQAEAGSAVEVEPEREHETVLESAEKIKAEEGKEPEDVGAVNTAPQQLPLGNGVPEKPNALGDPPTNEPSGQLENGSTDSAAEKSGPSLKDELNGEARNISIENSQSPSMSHVAVVEEVKHSSDDNIVKLEAISEGTIPSEPKTDVSSEERSFSYLVTGVDLEPQSEELCPHKDTETETKDSIEDVEDDKDIAVDRMKQESESGNESVEGSECMVSSIEGDQSTNKDDDEEAIHEQAQVEMTQAPLETSVVKRQQVYMIKVPRFIDDELQKKIQVAVFEVQKKTEEREEISKETRKQTEIVNKYSLDYKAELAKERAARAVFTAKRQELERKQELINRINNANSIANIDEKIRNMIHRQQHETISLKQETQYIHDMNQMKRQREQLSSKRASQEKIDEALSQRDEVEVKLKNLKKELDSLRAALSLAESSTKSAWNKYMDEVQCLRNLKEKHNAADGERHEAYLRLKKLRNQSAEKAKHFKMYKADQSAATNYIFSGDNQGLRSHCSSQVERIMDLWNNNAEFREQYVKYNMYSTLRRLGTSDGRSLGPGEEAPIVRSHVDKMSNTISAPSSKIENLAPSSKIETPAPVLVAEVKQGNLIESSAAKQVARTNQSAKSKSSTKPALADCNMPTVSNSEASKEAEKENKLKKEEEELARQADELARKEDELRKEKAAKEEELRKEKVAAELKEQLRLEQKAKAKEAEERKRRKAEKAQAKVEYRAQKEAKLKEKKKAKKETKKSGTVATANGGTDSGSTPVPDTTPPETSQEPATSSAATSKKRSARPASSTRQYNRVQVPVPLPLRNRGKRKMMTWMWALLVILLVLLLFFTGNYISFSTRGLPDFGF